MARAKARLPAWSLTAGALDVKAGATVKLYEPGTASAGGSSTSGTPFGSNIYAGLSGGSPISTTLTADSLGQAVVYTDTPRRMDVGISGSGISPYVYSYEGWDLDPIETLTTPRTGQYPAVAYGLGLGSLSDHAAIALAVAACDAGGGGEVLLPHGTFSPSSAIDLPSGVKLRGAGAGSTIIRLNSSDNANLFSAGAISSGGVLLASDGTEGARTVTLASGGVAALGLVVGDLICLVVTDMTANQYSVVKGISGQIITLSDPLYETYTTANGATMRKVTPVSNIGLSDMTLDGTLATGTTAHGVYWLNTLNATLENVTVQNFANGSGVLIVGGYGLQARGVRALKCGNLGYADFEISNITAAQCSDILSTNSSGFGPCFFFVNGSVVSNITSNGATDRGLKLANAAYNAFTNVHVANSGIAYAGLAITILSHHNNFTNVIALRNGVAGIWLEGTASNTGVHHNRLVNCTSLYNENYDLEIDQYAHDNTVEGNVLMNGSYDQGSRNVVKSSTHGQTQTAVGKNTGITTASTSYADLDGTGVGDKLRCDFTTTGGTIEADLDAYFFHSFVGGNAYIALSLDGAAEVAERAIAFDTATFTQAMSTKHRFTGVAPGAHYVVARYKTSSATLGVANIWRSLRIREGVFG